MLGTIVLLRLLSAVGSENVKIWFELKGILFMTMNSRNNQLFMTDELKVESKYLVHVFALDGYTYGLNTAGCKDCSLCLYMYYILVNPFLFRNIYLFLEKF